MFSPVPGAGLMHDVREQALQLAPGLVGFMAGCEQHDPKGAR